MGGIRCGDVCQTVMARRFSEVELMSDAKLSEWFGETSMRRLGCFYKCRYGNMQRSK